MREDFEAVAIVAKYNSLSDIDYYITSDVVDTFMCDIKCEVFNLSGETLVSMDLGTMLSGHESKKLCLKSLDEGLTQINCHLVFSYNDQHGILQNRTFDHLPIERIPAKKEDVEISILINSDDTAEASLTIKNKAFLKDLWITSEGVKMHLNRNFESLLPGIHTFHIHFDQPLGEESIDMSLFKLKWL